MAEVEQHATSSDPLLQCCLCTGLLRDAVQLSCLHNCCQRCFSTAASQSSSQGVACVSCGTVTQIGCEQTNGFIDGLVQCYTMIAESGTCGVCTRKDEHDNPAVVWCLTCRHSLCEDCVNEHQVKNSEHTMQCLEAVNILDELSVQATGTTCAVHKKPCEVACLTCEQAKCSRCWAMCLERGHEMHIVSEDSFDKYIGNLVTRITTMEKALLRKSEVLEKPKMFLRLTKAARDRHLNDLKQRKRRIMNAVEMAFEKIELATKNSYDDLKAVGDEAAATAARIASDLSEARKYICRLIDSNVKCEIFKQQKIVRERLSVLSSELDIWIGRLTTTMGEVNIESSLPEDLEEVIGAWIGKPQVYSGETYSSVQLPVDCIDVGLTADGRSLLLAALKLGMIEFSSSSSSELSRWQPSKYSSGIDDEVWAVAALSDGRAAVSLLLARCVLLLRQREKRSEKDSGGAAVSSWGQRLVAAGHDAWTEDLRVQLPWRPRWLSAHGDVLAVSEWHVGHRLQLLSSSSGRLLSTKRQSEYRIGCLAVTARSFVTGSRYEVELGLGNRAAYVLDAHSLADDGSDERLWRHVLSSSDVEEDEKLQGICADSSGGCLYAAVWRNDASSGRVSVLSLADGSELRRSALNFSPAASPAQPLLLPVRLSLSDDATLSSISGCVLLLAVLRCDSNTKQCRTVTVHRSIWDRLQ